jgi:hypothetical protein
MNVTDLLAWERDRNRRLERDLVEARASLAAVLRAWILAGIAPSDKQALRRARKVLGWKGRAQGAPFHGKAT